MRRVDWVERLRQTIEGHRSFPFEWGARDGAHDCCTFAAACVEAATGRAVVDELLTHYSDEASALAFIKASGGLAPAISSILGSPKPIDSARIGDIAIVIIKRKEFVGVIVENEIISAGPTGLVTNPLERGVTCWGV